MYTLMMITEYVGIIMLVLELFYVMYQKKSYMQNLLLILVISCLISVCLGQNKIALKH